MKSIKTGKHSVNLSFYLLYSGWTIIILIITYWYYNTTVEETYLLAKKEAFKGYEKDVIMRLWATEHGGVYVAIDEHTKPNPYLEVNERDIETPSGKKLTLMNPAYITRQVHEIYFRELGIKSHITSLNPIRKENAADKWEKSALKKFEAGVKEVFSIDTINGESYFRYMAPLITNEGCLKCHAKQGYKVGDIRGGISSSIKWRDYEDSITSQLYKIIFGMGIIWFIGFLGITFIRTRFIGYIDFRDKSESEIKGKNLQLNETKVLLEKNLIEKEELICQLSKTKHELEVNNAEKDKLFSVVAHDLRSPFQGFIGLTEIMADSTEDFSKEEIVAISKQLNSSAANLYKMLHNLLEWVKNQKGLIDNNPTPNNLLELVQNSIEFYTNKIIEKGIIIELNIEPSIIIDVDINMFNTVLRNFLTNAIKFSFRGGKIQFDSSYDNNVVTITIRDYGIGMDENLKSKLFIIGENIGRKGTNDEPSSGLGLILCKEFVQKMGGTISVESEKDKGSSFKFTVPRFIN